MDQSMKQFMPQGIAENSRVLAINGAQQLVWSEKESQKTTDYIYTKCLRAGKSINAGSRLVIAYAEEGMGFKRVTAKGVTFGGDKNALKLTVVLVPYICE